MESYSIADAKARLSELVERVEAGESVDITKRGKHVATLTPAKKALQPFDFDELRRVTKNQPIQTEDAGEFVRKMRENARY